MDPDDLEATLLGAPCELTPDQVADALAEDASYELKRLRRRSVRGYRSLTPHLLRRTSVEA